MPARNFTDQEEEMIASIYKSGISARAIARAYGLSHHISIISALNRQGVAQRSPSERNRKYRVNANAFDACTAEMFYWWGFLYADGYIWRDKTLTVALKRADLDHLVKLSKFLECDAPIRETDTYANNKRYEAAIFSITERHMVERLAKLGVVSGRSEFYRVPGIIKTPLANHWIRGLFDGDGSIDFKKSDGQPRLRIVGQREMIEWIRTQLPIRTANPRLHKSGMYYLVVGGRRKVKGIGDYMYKDATVFMDRKHDLYMRTKIEPPNRERNELGQYV